MRLSDGDQRHEGAVQPRSLGVTPFVPVRDIGATLERGVESARPRDRRFSETRVGDEYEVLEERGGGIVRWRLDPARGWSPTRVTFERDGHVMQEARSSLRQQDGIWYPEKVEYFNSQYADGAKPESVIRSTKVEFLRPEHPSDFCRRTSESSRDFSWSESGPSRGRKQRCGTAREPSRLRNGLGSNAVALSSAVQRIARR